MPSVGDLPLAGLVSSQDCELQHKCTNENASWDRLFTVQ